MNREDIDNLSDQLKEFCVDRNKDFLLIVNYKVICFAMKVNVISQGFTAIHYIGNKAALITARIIDLKFFSISSPNS